MTNDRHGPPAVRHHNRDRPHIRDVQLFSRSHLERLEIKQNITKDEAGRSEARRNKRPGQRSLGATRDNKPTRTTTEAQAEPPALLERRVQIAQCVGFQHTQRPGGVGKGIRSIHHGGSSRVSSGHESA